MKQLAIILGFALIGTLAACGDDGNNNVTPDANTPDTAVDADPNAMPAINATQIDRVGRPAISTALQATFEADQATREQAKNMYNMDNSPANWSTYAGAAPANPGEYASGFYGSLAILDSLDAMCGNQIAYDADAQYAPLAGVLADDRLWVNSASGDCAVSYLAVEANALNIIPNNDCGGRTLAVDIVDRSYSVLAAGQLAGVTDGVDANDVAFQDAFPYLAAPH